jgi:DNA-binding response OmpR family regulator
MPDTNTRLLLVEDEIRIAEFVLPALEAAGFLVTHLRDGASGLAAILSDEHDMVVLDVMMPVMDGFEVLAKVRQAGNAIPVIILSARGELPDRLHGFESGADDYLPKPFFVEELIARARAMMARKRGKDLVEITVGDLTLNKLNYNVNWRGTVATLSQREFSLIECLMRSPNRIFSRQQILKNVWDINFDPETNVVDVCIQRIRKKLNRQARDGKLLPIETIRGVGYRFRKEELE